MSSDQFIPLKDVPDIYTDSSSDSSDDDSINALLPSKSRESLTSLPESSLTTPVNVPSSPLKKPVSPKSDKSETSTSKPKKSEKRDLDKTAEPKPKKVKQSKPKVPKGSEKTSEAVSRSLSVEKETKEEKAKEKAPKSPKVKPATTSSTPSETGESKESSLSPKKKSKPKKPKSTPSFQETNTELSDEAKLSYENIEPSVGEVPRPNKTEKGNKTHSSPKRKKQEGAPVESVKRPQADSEPKPKKQKKNKNKEANKEKQGQSEAVSRSLSVEKENKEERVEEKEKRKEESEEERKEKKDSLEVLKKLSNRDVFNSLSKDTFDDIPLGSLKAKHLALEASSGSDTDTGSDSLTDSDSFVKPRLNKSEEERKEVENKKLETKKETEKEKNKVSFEKEESTRTSGKVEEKAHKKLSEEKKIERKEESEEEESSDSSDDTSDYEESEDEKEEMTPKPRLTPAVDGPKISGEQFINKERLQTSFKPKMDIPAGCEIYCGNLPVDISEDELRELFEECGVITRINKLNKKGVAFITFSNEESAQKASEYNNSPYKGQLLNINITTNRPKKEFGKGGFGRSDSFSAKNKDNKEIPISNEICIRNLNFNSTEEGLRELFGECGQVTRCYVPKFQDSGKPMGICFITFTTVEAAKRAVEYDQTEIDGRTVSIQYAQPRGNRSNNRGRALKGRFTTGGSRVSTFSRPLNNSKVTNGTNGTFKDKKDFKNGFVKASEPLNPNVVFVGSETKPKSIIFEDSDSE